MAISLLRFPYSLISKPADAAYYNKERKKENIPETQFQGPEGCNRFAHWGSSLCPRLRTSHQPCGHQHLSQKSHRKSDLHLLTAFPHPAMGPQAQPTHRPMSQPGFSQSLLQGRCMVPRFATTPVPLVALLLSETRWASLWSPAKLNLLKRVSLIPAQRLETLQAVAPVKPVTLALLTSVTDHSFQL